MTYHPGFFSSLLKRRLLLSLFLSVSLAALFPPVPERAVAAREGRNTRLLPHLLEGTQDSTNGVQGSEDLCPLAPGVPVRKEIAGGEVHAYRFALLRDQFAHVVVEQRGLDLTVRLFGPDGGQRADVNNPNGAPDSERISVLAGSASGYHINIAEHQPGAAQDESRAAAERASAEGERLRAQDTAESLPKAIKKYEEALALWRAVGDRSAEVNTLLNLGLVYRRLSKEKEATGYFEEALALS